MRWDITSFNISDDVLNRIEQDLIEYLPGATERSYGPQPLADAQLMPIVSPSELGNYDPNTRQMVLTRFNHTGIFRLASHCQTGTNVIATEIDTMTVYLQKATAAMRVCSNKIDRYVRGEAETNIVDKSEAYGLAKAWKSTIETAGYVGIPSAGLQGLFTLPFGDYTFSGTWQSLTAEQILDQLQLAIAAHDSTFADSDLKILALPTGAYNLTKSKRLVGSSKPVMSAFLESNPGYSIIKVPQFNVADAGQPLGYLLPNDSEQLALVVDSDMALRPYNDRTQLMVEAEIYIASVVAKNPTCGLRLRGL